MTAFRVGLTGGLASGKSTVARWLAESGLTVVDADQLVADLYRPDQAGSRLVAELFGQEMLTEDGAVDHQRLAELVFADVDARRRLEARVHPLVGRRFSQMAEETDGTLVLEATLLAQSGFMSHFDHVVTVEADRELRLTRAVARGISRREAQARIAAQGPDAARTAAADSILTNNGTLEELRRQVDRLLVVLLELKQKDAAR